jgi:hypothetical protein
MKQTFSTNQTKSFTEKCKNQQPPPPSLQQQIKNHNLKTKYLENAMPGLFSSQAR